MQARLKELVKQRETDVDLHRGYVLDRLKQIVETCMTMGRQWNPSAALRALELLGRHQGMFSTPEAVRSAILDLARQAGAEPSDAAGALLWMVEQHDAALMGNPNMIRGKGGQRLEVVIVNQTQHGIGDASL